MTLDSSFIDCVGQAEHFLKQQGVRLSLGAEPTFVPQNPCGAEWSHAALGPQKLEYARQMAAHLLQGKMRGGFALLSPGKLYPGETNPRWNLRIVSRRDGKPFFPEIARRGSAPDAKEFAKKLAARLRIKPAWLSFRDPLDPAHIVLAIPLDHNGEKWTTAPWPISHAQRELIAAEGPAGLRLPLETLPPGIPRRVLTLSWKGRATTVFLPPLLQKPFLECLEVLCGEAMQGGLGELRLEGYLPEDHEGMWTVLNLTPDPGVLEANLPPSTSWQEFSSWMEAVSEAAAAVGLRTWKEGSFSEGTGGGCHLLWGSPEPGESPFFTRPAWLAAVLKFWQAHPSLSYLFTGFYVGASSQAPRPDESGHPFHDLALVNRFLETLPPGDHRGLINEALRHFHTDASGNTHRSEISFDKFWNPEWPGGAAGLIEFRAIETMPETAWIRAVAGLWTCLGAALLKNSRGIRMRNHGRALHDRFFLPTVLWADFEEVLLFLHSQGWPLPAEPFRGIWEWRFPVMLDWGRGALIVRRAPELWPLLSEIPLQGGLTSRFVDASLRRLEFSCTPEFASTHLLTLNGREVPFRRRLGKRLVAGVRFRFTRLRPSLHPGILPHVPLRLRIFARENHRLTTEFEILSDSAPAGAAESPPTRPGKEGKPLRGIQPSDWTLDLRF